MSAHSQMYRWLRRSSWNTVLSRRLARMRSWWRTNWSVLLPQILSRKLSTLPRALCNWQLQQAVSRKILSLRSFFFYRLLWDDAGQPFTFCVVKLSRDSVHTVIRWAAIHLGFHLGLKNTADGTEVAYWALCEVKRGSALLFRNWIVWKGCSQSDWCILCSCVLLNECCYNLQGWHSTEAYFAQAAAIRIKSETTFLIEASQQGQRNRFTIMWHTKRRVWKTRTEAIKGDIQSVSQLCNAPYTILMQLFWQQQEAATSWTHQGRDLIYSAAILSVHCLPMRKEESAILMAKPCKRFCNRNVSHHQSYETLWLKSCKL